MHDEQLPVAVGTGADAQRDHLQFFCYLFGHFCRDAFQQDGEGPGLFEDFCILKEPVR